MSPKGLYSLQRKNHPNWRAVQHLFPPEAKSFSQDNVDPEGAPATPKPASTPLFDDQSIAAPHRGRDTESILADDVLMVEIEAMERRDSAILQPNEDNVADIFGDFDEPDSAMGDEPVDPNSMVDVLRMAGVAESTASGFAEMICSVKPSTEPPPRLIEVYGRSIHDFTMAKRRNFNVEGLASYETYKIHEQLHLHGFTNATKMQVGSRTSTSGRQQMSGCTRLPLSIG